MMMIFLLAQIPDLVRLKWELLLNVILFWLLHQPILFHIELLEAIPLTLGNFNIPSQALDTFRIEYYIYIWLISCGNFVEY